MPVALNIPPPPERVTDLPGRPEMPEVSLHKANTIFSSTHDHTLASVTLPSPNTAKQPTDAPASTSDDFTMAFPHFSILTPNAMLGYGYKKEHFWYGIEMYKPAAIIVDSGSTDGGPYKLGMNKMTCGREAYIRDLTPILEACFHRKIQVLISSVGGDGSNLHVQEMLSIVKEVAESKGFSFKIATISHQISRDLIKKRIVEQNCSPCGPLPNISVEDVDNAVEYVAQMGAEP